ncbi:sigma-70 family RNA polymerase sigma factor [Candidatus Dojkabacteria bacterium]|nr:sigma-70 family RNA polymerase sigma factor [Candidatus Dojkabacteria bacterium]
MDLAREQKLVEQAKESLKAFDQLYEYYLPRIFAYVLNRTANKQISEDVTSQTFIKAMTKIKTFRYKGFSFGAWLYRIAHNNLMDYYRKNPSLNIIDLSEVESKDRTDKEAEKSERQAIILEALKKLPKQYQEILSLKFFEELSNEEMAEVLGCKKETLAVKLHRSLKAFKKILEKENLLEVLNVEI